MQFGDQCHGGQRVDSVEAAQPGHGGRIRFDRRPVLECELHHPYALRRLVECDAVRIEDGLVGGLLEPQPSQPLLVGQRPVPPPPAKPAAEQELA